MRRGTAAGAALAVLVAGLVTISVHHTHHTQAIASPRVQSNGVEASADQPRQIGHDDQTATSLAAWRRPSSQIAARSAAATVTSRRNYPLSARLRAMVPKSTVLAHLLRRTAGYATATARHANRHIPEYWYGRRAVLPVVAAKHSRLKVRLERRPNGSTSWIRANAVGYSHTPYAILIDLKYRRLFWFEHGHRKGSAPVGIGAPDDPTPTGKYFIAFHSPPPSAGYGSVVLATSAHSNTIKDFEGFNDAIIAIHGPLGEEAAIRPNGAAISHGCIRMLNGALDKIRHFPNGTPIIIAS